MIKNTAEQFNFEKNNTGFLVKQAVFRGNNEGKNFEMTHIEDKGSFIRFYFVNNVTNKQYFIDLSSDDAKL